MAIRSAIEWCDATFNPWLGCTKVSPACDHCYAEAWAKRAGHPDLWQGERRRTRPDYWRQPPKWNRLAKAEGRRWRVFCASLADWLDNQADPQWRDDLAILIDETPQLDWLLLTKRPQNWGKLAPWHDDDVPANVWVGTTAENQEEAARRIPMLRAIPARVRFLSCEPLLGSIDLWDAGWYDFGEASVQVDWVICGGESGPGARDMDAAWARSLRDQCATAGVAFFMKQMSRRRPIPDDLLVRQFPEPAVGYGDADPDPDC